MSTRVFALAALLAAPLLLAGALIAFSRPAGLALAAPATGTVTGQVVWNAPLPVPYGAPGMSGAEGAPGMSSGGEAVPGMSPETEVEPDASGEAAPGLMPEAGRAFPMPRPPIPIRPPVPRLIPAGAVLVAVQGTGLAARTDENGRFRIEGVPTGQYFLVAAGPVRGAATAFTLRPNVFLRDAGQTVDLGRLYLGQSYGYGPLPYGASAAPEAPAEETP